MQYKHIIEKMSLEDKVALCSGSDYWHTKALEQYGITSIMLTDGPHGLRKQIAAADNLGLNRSVPSTCFPTASATACSWDRDLLQEMGTSLGEETLQEQVSVLLGPGVNIQRNPLCGRNFEYFSEDPYLTGEMAISWINGVQSKGVGVSIKHFAGNSQENQRMSSDSLVDERTLREIYLSAFEKTIKTAKPATVMCAYNKLNGTYCSDNRYLLKEILRDEWGFEGVIVTDWGAMNDRIKAFKAGLDLEMPGGMSVFDHEVFAAVKNGDLPEKLIDESVNRLLNLIFAAEKNRQSDFHYDVNEHHSLAKKIAASSAVLLKNEDNILPISHHQKIALIGALAKYPRYQGAGSSIINPTLLPNALNGFDNQSLNYTFYEGYSLKARPDEQLCMEAVAGAMASDIAVIFAGLTEDYESEGFDRTSLSMPENQNELINRVTDANPKTVVVLVGGAPVEMPWLSKVKAVLNMLLAGQAGGLAAAELLTGTVNPSGKLAATYPLSYQDVPSAGFFEKGGKQAQYREGIYVGYRFYDKAQKDVLFPFGHGLSYTAFEYTNLILSKTEMNDSEELTVTATIKNTGNLDGAEIVQLYIGDLQQVIFRPEKELKDFTKIFLKAGQEKQVSFTLKFRSFACYVVSSQAWIVPDGAYRVSIAASSRDIRLQTNIKIHGTVVDATQVVTTSWYKTLHGKVSEKDFEVLLGKEIEEMQNLKKGEFTLSSTLQDMQENFVIRQVIKYAEKRIGKSCGCIDYHNPTFRMMMASAIEVPMKNLVMLSSGDMPANIAQGLVHMANGKYFRGIKAMLRITG
ncbi:MAG: glycosyl hydrolase [Chloroflexi bacterium HGW-Chloroflexi-10]|nr:MAG: glycosyl hydrolase [Chloroflexi bacterium HGW-Chloroflexi-10]